MSEMLNLEEPQINTTLPTDKIIPFVKYDGHNIYKSTLVSQLNAHPLLRRKCSWVLGWIVECILCREVQQPCHL